MWTPITDNSEDIKVEQMSNINQRQNNKYQIKSNQINLYPISLVYSYSYSYSYHQIDILQQIYYDEVIIDYFYSNPLLLYYIYQYNRS